MILTCCRLKNKKADNQSVKEAKTNDIKEAL